MEIIMKEAPWIKAALFIGMVPILLVITRSPLRLPGPQPVLPVTLFFVLHSQHHFLYLN